MGRQVNFYVSNKDANLMLSDIRKVEPVYLLHSRSPESQPNILDSEEIPECELPSPLFLLVREADLKNLEMSFVSRQAYWTIDTTKACVMEFDTGYSDGKIMRRGRLYCVDSFYNQNRELIQKPEEFRRWTRSVLRICKKRLTKLGPESEYAGYIGEDAAHWLATSGGTLKEI
jgi:hypothetical protein